MNEIQVFTDKDDKMYYVPRGNAHVIIPRIGERLLFGAVSGVVVNVIHDWDSLQRPIIKIIVEC